MPEFDNNLDAWGMIEGREQWASLLLGNGLSQNVWPKFDYPSLYDRACGPDIARPLDGESQHIFDTLATRNFEFVLNSLSTAQLALNALGRDSAFLGEIYTRIQNALIDAVHSLHIPWNDLPALSRASLAAALSAYDKVFSTNYDLLIYWSIMSDLKSFKDYFWSETFDLADTDVWGKTTTIHYLHGGLHLYRRIDGRTLKRSSGPGQNLLDLFADPLPDALPLFITEGTSAQKLASIYRSEYLSFVFSRFSDDDAPLVVFGHGLSAHDDHIVHALRARGGRKMAISIKHDGDIRAKKLEIAAKIPKADLYFFDAATHPLGDPALTVAAA